MSEATYLTDARLIIAESLSKHTPYAITGVSHGYFSVARHYGGATYNGSEYTYIPATDELIRDDVIKAITAAEKKPRSTKRVTRDLFPLNETETT